MAIVVCGAIATAQEKKCCGSSVACQDKQKVESCSAKGACEFEGLTLTEAQKTQLKALGTCQQACDPAKASCPVAKKERMTKIKSILTAEQYVQYLENNYLKEKGHCGGKQGGQCKANKR